jgi:large subunit ribosomal protein L10
MSKRVKEMQIGAIRQRLGDARDLLVIDEAKLDGKTANRFRLALRKQNIRSLAVKNALAKVALREAGVTGLDAVLEGPSTLVWGGQDIVALSKEISKWARDLEALKIKGGTVEGSGLDAKGIEALSKSPSREELIAQIAGQILSPGANLAALLLGPGGQLAAQLKTIYEKEDKGEAA